MHAILLATTLVSLGAAVAMAIVTWRVLGRERARSAARIAALAAAAEIDPEVTPEEGDRLPQGSAAGLQPSRDGALHGAEAADPPPSVLFAAIEGGPAPRAPLLLAVSALLIVVLLVVAGVAARGTGSATDAAGGALAAEPLELAALRAVRADGMLTIEGLVRNPRRGPTRAHLTVLVTLVDEAGIAVKTVEAPLDAAALGPGDESRFVVPTADVPAAVRYRVSFRTAEGRTLPHVDRRARSDRTTVSTAPGGGAP
jgi:hypothetical protein